MILKMCIRDRTKIHDYDDLNTLFFQVLARDMGSRTHSIMRDFAYVPYLNSCLLYTSGKY